jgi:hypothetical protein
MRHRWTLFIPPLVCGLLADLCLVLLPFRPAHDGAVSLLILYTIFGTAIAWELFQAQQPRRRGLVELRSIRTGGVERPAFLVPYFPHLTMAIILVALFLVGVSLETQIFVLVHPSHALNPRFTGWHLMLDTSARCLSLPGLALGIWIVGKCLRPLFSSRSGLAVLSEGVWLCSGQLECFFPWEAIEKVSTVKLKVVAGRGALCTGIGVTSVEEVRTASRWRRWMKRMKARTGWHLLVPPLGYALTSDQMSLLLQTYLFRAEERARIGTVAELARVKTALQITGG